MAGTGLKTTPLSGPLLSDKLVVNTTKFFVCLFQGVCKALNTWSPLCASFFLSFSLSLSGLLSPHTVCIRCATLSPGGSRGTGTAKIVELRPGLEDRGWEKRTVLKPQIETNHQRLLLSSRPAVVDGDGHMAVIDIAKCVSRRP